MKKHHFVYKITNSINNKYYIGVHSTDIIEDGYMGSGSLLKKDIKEYGISIFNREILFHFESRDEALKKELEIVNYDLLEDDNCYNLILGGAIGVKTIQKKRHLFREPIYSKYANDIKTDVFLRFDKKYKYIFKENTEFLEDQMHKLEINQYIAEQHNRQEIKMTNLGLEIERILYASVPKLAENLTNAYNNKIHNKNMQKFLNVLGSYGLTNMIFINKVEWNQQTMLVFN